MKKYVLSLILILSVIGTVAGFAVAQKQTTDQGAMTPADQGQPVTVKGKIAYTKALGGYYVKGEDPAGEFMIVNQDAKLLDGLFKSGKNVTINGRLRGADFLTIEKIDGMKYGALKELPRK
jgi:hypothetical protein